MFGFWIEALSTCAIEGNQYAIDMLKLKDTDKDAFFKELVKLVKKGKIDDAHN